MSSYATRHTANLTVLELEGERTRLTSLLGQQETEIAETRAQLATVSTELDKRRRGAPEPRLSDHAIIRFLERAMHVDIEAVRRRIMTEKTKAAIRAGAVSVIVEGVRLKVADNAIITVIDPPAKSFRTAPKSQREATDEAAIREGLAEHFDDLAREAVG